MKFSWLFFSTAIALVLLPQLALACAVAIEENSTGTGWNYAMPTRAQGFISYENGTERLVMSHELGGTGGGGVAIITPIPGGPTDIKLDILSDLPQLNGQNISTTASAVVPAVAELVSMSQLWTGAPWFISGFNVGSSVQDTSGINIGSTAPGGGSFGATNAGIPDVRVFNQLDKNGMSSEVVTARTSKGLYDFLKAKGLTVPDGSIDVLNYYIGRNYSFVVSWVNATAAHSFDCQQNQAPVGFGSYAPHSSSSCAKGIFVSFPTKDLYYPLIPTSAYSDMSHSETIRVIGHVSPKLYSSISNYSTVSYFEDANYSSRASDTDAQKIVHPMAGDIVKYTDITIDAPAKLYTEDLTIRNYPPINAIYAGTIADNPIIFGILLLVIASILASVLCGLLFYTEDRSKQGVFKFAKLGLFNCLTLIGLIVASRKMLRPEGDGVSSVHMHVKRRWKYLFLFTIMFTVITWLIAWLVMATV